MNEIDQLTPITDQSLELEFAESIHAGFPSPAADRVGERIDIVAALSPHKETTFYARVSGDSMQDANLLDGDIVVVDRSLQPANGDFIVAAIDGEFTIKEFQVDKVNGIGWLVPHNKKYSPIKVSEANNFTCWGVITYVIHKM